MELKSGLETYSILTKNLIEKTKQGEELEILLEEREKIIQAIYKLSFSREEFKVLSEEFKIFELEEEFQKQIEIEKGNIKNKIETIKKATLARKRYDDMKFKPTFFNKKC